MAETVSRGNFPPHDLQGFPLSGDTETRYLSGIAEPDLVKWGMQPPKTQAHPTSLGLLLRVARKQWSCEGSGGNPRRYADDCADTIFPGEHYVEYLGESHAYESGHRYCLACAREFWQVGVKYEDGGRKAELINV